jgi:hypothetical protein
MMTPLTLSGRAAIATTRTVVIVAFFDSDNSAMENSNLPETAAIADRMAALAMGRRCPTTSTSSTSSLDLRVGHCAVGIERLSVISAPTAPV